MKKQSILGGYLICSLILFNLNLTAFSQDPDSLEPPKIIEITDDTTWEINNRPGTEVPGAIYKQTYHYKGDLTIKRGV